MSTKNHHIASGNFACGEIPENVCRQSQCDSCSEEKSQFEANRGAVGRARSSLRTVQNSHSLAMGLDGGGSEFNSFSNDLCKFTIPNIHEKKMQEDERIVLRIIVHSKSTKWGGAVAKLLTTTAHQPVRLFVYCICLRLIVIWIAWCRRLLLKAIHSNEVLGSCVVSKASLDLTRASGYWSRVEGRGSRVEGRGPTWIREKSA